MTRTSSLVLGLLLLVAGVCLGQSEKKATLRMVDVMTADEVRETGVSTLSLAQRRALDQWLERYTLTLLKVAGGHREAPTPGSGRVGSNADCSRAIESTIAGDFEGWDGETVFKLDNGQIWEQSEYDYMYSYQYRPDVTIYSTNSGCRMKVEDENETVLVRRVK
jgi:hypothetical protein